MERALDLSRFAFNVAWALVAVVLAGSVIVDVFSVLGDRLTWQSVATECVRSL